MWYFILKRSYVLTYVTRIPRQRDKYTDIMLLDFSCFPTEIPNFLSDEECDHIIRLAKNEGLETSQTSKEGEKQDTMSLGKNTKKYFQVWDQNRDGQIDMDEVKYL